MFRCSDNQLTLAQWRGKKHRMVDKISTYSPYLDDGITRRTNVSGALVVRTCFGVWWGANFDANSNITKRAFLVPQAADNHGTQSGFSRAECRHRYISTPPKTHAGNIQSQCWLNSIETRHQRRQLSPAEDSGSLQTSLRLCRYFEMLSIIARDIWQLCHKTPTLTILENSQYFGNFYWRNIKYKKNCRTYTHTMFEESRHLRFRVNVRGTTGYHENKQLYFIEEENWLYKK